MSRAFGSAARIGCEVRKLGSFREEGRAPDRPIGNGRPSAAPVPPQD